MSKLGLTTAIITILIVIVCLTMPALSQAALIVKPDKYDFGVVDVGNPSSTTIKVSTDMLCVIAGVKLDGSEDFEITSVSPGVPIPLMPGNILSINITYTPSSFGASSANLLIYYHTFGFQASAAGAVSVGLTGEGKAGVMEIDIDIKPGSDPNSINLKSKGVVPVAALGSDEFDATTINPDPETVVFAGAKPVRSTQEDVNEDGYMDLLFHFKTQELKLDADSTEATLSGTTYDGQSVAGTDAVNIVPKKKDE